MGNRTKAEAVLAMAAQLTPGDAPCLAKRTALAKGQLVGGQMNFIQRSEALNIYSTGQPRRHRTNPPQAAEPALVPHAGSCS
jgi:hypothetical protein